MDRWAGDYINPITLTKWVYANENPINYADPSGKWTCIGHQDCKEWVNKTLTELSNSGQTGKYIVDFFKRYDNNIGVLQQISSCNTSLGIQFGVQIVFGEPWPGPSWGTTTFSDVLQLSNDPNVINSGTPEGFGIQLFGHEVSHWAQGLNRFTIQGELLSRYVEQQLRKDLIPKYGIIKEGSDTTKYLVDTYNPFYVPDLERARHWMGAYFSAGYLLLPLPSLGYLSKDWLDEFHVKIIPPRIKDPLPMPVPTPGAYPIITPTP